MSHMNLGNLEMFYATLSPVCMHMTTCMYVLMRMNMRMFVNVYMEKGAGVDKDEA